MGGRPVVRDGLLIAVGLNNWRSSSLGARVELYRSPDASFGVDARSPADDSSASLQAVESCTRRASALDALWSLGGTAPTDTDIP